MENKDPQRENEESDLSFSKKQFQSQTGEKIDQEARKKDLLKEIDLIQSIVNRMANTSFLIKGWTITMITFIFAYKSDKDAVILVFIPIILFWLLDAHFLQYERLYRKLYQWVIQNRMTNESDLFSLNVVRFKDENQSFFRAITSFTLSIFYGGAIVLVITYILYSQYFL